MPTVYRKYQAQVSHPGPPKITSHEHFFGEEKRKRGVGYRFTHMMPAVLVTLGSILVANVAWPIISYQFFVSPQLQQNSMVSPVMTRAEELYTNPGVAVAQAADTIPTTQRPPTILSEDLDYTNLSSWFPTLEIPEVRPEEAKTYTIDIPALGVEKAVVKIGGLDLDKNLIQYPGTADPGEMGAPVIFGHSVSPIFYNPSLRNPRRYTSLFTKIMDLKHDDKIIVTSDGVTYTYRVASKVEVKPDDTSILEQAYDARQLKLVTCTPPGTMLRRGIVYAILEDVTQ